MLNEHVKPSVLVINYLPLESLAMGAESIIVLARFESKNYPLWVGHYTNPDGKPYYALWRNKNHHITRSNLLQHVLDFGYSEGYNLCRAAISEPPCDCPKCTEL